MHYKQTCLNGIIAGRRIMSRSHQTLTIKHGFQSVFFLNDVYWFLTTTNLTQVKAYRRIPVISPPDYKRTSLLIEISSRLYPCYTGYRIHLTIIRRYISDIFIIINQLQQRFFNRISMNRIPSKSQLNLISVPLSVASLFVAVVQIP